MKIYNDCPICGVYLEKSSLQNITLFLSCGNCFYALYQASSCFVEDFIIGPYVIRKLIQNTHFLTTSHISIFSLKKSLNYEKFNSISKIKTILAIV